MMAASAKPNVDPLFRERREAARRASRDESRRMRVLHAKSRIIGVDEQALARQVREREEREQRERERNAYFDRLNSIHAEAIKHSDVEAQHNRAEQVMQTKLFNKQQAREKHFRDVQEECKRAEPSDRLHFVGEDPGFATRTRAQKAQQQDWLAAQLDQLCKKEERERQENESYEQEQARLHQLLLENEAQQQHEQKERRIQTRLENERLAKEKQLRESMELNRQAQEAEEEIITTAASAFLNEVSGTTVDSFKGFSTAQRQYILDEQARQQRDLEVKREMEADQERRDAQYMEQTRRERLLRERERAEHDASMRVEFSLVQRQQEKEMNNKTQALNEVYSNQVTDDFFNQFGTSCR